VPFTDDPTITNTDLLLRRIPPAWWVYDEALQRKRPTTAAFDDPEMSVALASVLHDLAEPLTAPLRGHDGFALVSLGPELARACGQAVCRDPLPEDPAHGLVVGKKTESIKKKFARNCAWVVPPEE
jgi:hypothetical protein